jgi:hypothetical protein
MVENVLTEEVVRIWNMIILSQFLGVAATRQETLNYSAKNAIEARATIFNDPTKEGENRWKAQRSLQSLLTDKGRN